jgi:hypothetical protein
MSRYRHLIVTIGVIALLLLSIGAAAAKGNDQPKPPQTKGKPAHLTWTPGRIRQVVTPGQTIQVSATFSSSADIAAATLVIRGGLAKVLKANSSILTDIKAGTSTTLTFTATIPATGAHTLGGVVQLRAAGRILAQPLPVLLTVTKSNSASQGNTGKPAKPIKPIKPAKPAHS